ncbi:MAG: transcription-repair coupling factor [Anaerolineae bacterium]|nr:MAG: transcription-repair coupling factor [Anaerolineae bacterium]
MRLDGIYPEVMMAFDQLFEHIQDLSRELVRAIQERRGLVQLSLQRSARLPLAIALARALNSSVFWIVDRNDRALAMLEEVKIWDASLVPYLFAEPSVLFYEKTPWSETSRKERLTVLTHFAAAQLPGAKTPENPAFVVASARSVMTRTLPRREFLKALRTYKPGSVQSMESMIQQWIEMGYERVNTVLDVGQFARRGGILDVWPIALPCPVRLDFFGDQIETILPFDPLTQLTDRRKGELPALVVPPAREYLLNAAFLSQLENPDEICEFHLPYFHPYPASVLDYLPERTLLIVDDADWVRQTAAEIEEQAFELRQSALREAMITEESPSPHLSWSEIEDALSMRRGIQFSWEEDEHVDQKVFNIQQAFRTQPRFGGRLKSFIQHLKGLDSDRSTIWIVSRQASRLEELWRESSGGEATRLNGVSFVRGSLPEGFLFEARDGNVFHIFSDGEIFGIRPPETRHRKKSVVSSPEAQYADLQPGDYVVHVDHGIGIFVGLVTRTIDQVEREYLCIEYANQTQLFVPVYQADRVTRYVGADRKAPTLSHLGTAEWHTVKAHVGEAVVEVAQDLLDLYAKRSVVQGHAFSPDTPWQEELEASFPYIETEDQIRVLQEVKADMESPRPMDRLICGDVGYGKTEVALRAAFKCVVDGKQVAVLVPTTILAQQHYDTFRQRLAAFPLEVEMLSRFRTPQQQQEIIRKLAQGKIDIIIGTHRLLSNDVAFKDLGLLIIDEEQRFGVIHKEKLKKMRAEVDVLTLTATPIPRTLYLALSGVRDISTINTPPEERIPIITHVGPYSPELIRKAVLREIERGGQVFFVHNRVQTIEAMRRHLEKLIPEARIAVAHGQMPEKELAERMRQFTRGEVDILLSTSIIESGLDIPNANTLIVDRADTFGLAQLYQLRGRVGRGAQRAYAYFFRHKRRPPTPEGQQRLETIAENTQLGAGFSIAMRDLEMRGAGDILGTRQSGHVNAVGLHLYTRLLAEAIRRLGKQEGLLAPRLQPYEQELGSSVTVDLPLVAAIPSDYVPDKLLRLQLYRRMADLKSFGEIDKLQEEFQDRFGALPEAVMDLLYQMKVKLLAQRAGLASINVESGQLVLRFAECVQPPSQRFLHPAARWGKTAIWFAYKNVEDWRKTLLEILTELQHSLPESTPVAAYKPLV